MAWQREQSDTERWGEGGTQRQRDRLKDGDNERWERSTCRDAQKGECVAAERRQEPPTGGEGWVCSAGEEGALATATAHRRTE